MWQPRRSRFDRRESTVLLDVLTDAGAGDFAARVTPAGAGAEVAERVNDIIASNQWLEAELARVAQLVGTEGRLGERVPSPPAGEAWTASVASVNALIEALVRPATELQRVVGAIAEVTTAVTEGDLTRQVGVEASGEVAVLQGQLNEMIRNLRETTRRNTEQDWLNTNLERFARMLQGHRDLATVSRTILSELAPLIESQRSRFYTVVEDGAEEPVLHRRATYGYERRDGQAQRVALGDGLVGRCALEKRRILLTGAPGDYRRIDVGPGETPPANVMVLPILFEGSVRAVLEVVSSSCFDPTQQAFLERLTETIGLVVNTVEANTITETLLEQARSQTRELKARQEELRASNTDLARKAAQLAASSQYKAEFFSNMSHELRTPLNSLLILAHELEANAEHNLTEEQVRFASVIHSSGADLLRLLNDILDLAKIESGTVVLEVGPLALAEMVEVVESEFRPVAERNGVAFYVEVAPGVPPTIATDARRLRQVLKNLLANAFKFTDSGEVRLSVSPGRDTVSFAIQDTGIGISAPLRQRIFEAFAQADGTTAREYGGTGLGLSISRELVRLLGGEITLVNSTPDVGSTFTVEIPSGAALTRAPTLPSVPVPSPHTGAVFASAVALVIDDDFRNIFALTALLERAGLQVIPAESGEEGLAVLRGRRDVAVALVDIMMPVMDGYATMRRIREQWPSEALPIIAVTAKVAAGEHERCIDAGASAYVPKPVETDALLVLLSQWLPALPAEHAGN